MGCILHGVAKSWARLTSLHSRAPAPIWPAAHCSHARAERKLLITVSLRTALWLLGKVQGAHKGAPDVSEALNPWGQAFLFHAAKEVLQEGPRARPLRWQAIEQTLLSGKLRWSFKIWRLRWQLFIFLKLKPSLVRGVGITDLQVYQELLVNIDHHWEFLLWMLALQLSVAPLDVHPKLRGQRPAYLCWCNNLFLVFLPHSLPSVEKIGSKGQQAKGKSKIWWLSDHSSCFMNDRQIQQVHSTWASCISKTALSHYQRS